MTTARNELPTIEEAFEALSRTLASAHAEGGAGGAESLTPEEGAIAAPAASLARLVACLIASAPGGDSVESVGAMAASVSLGGAPRTSARVRDVLRLLAAKHPALWLHARAAVAEHAVRLECAGEIAEAHAQWRETYGALWPVDVQTSARPDVIRALTVRGARTVAQAHLALNGLIVLIGENGVGKSTIVEACELLRRVASPAFVDELNAIHGGLRLLLRHGARELALAVEVHGAGPPLHYELRLAPAGGGAVVSYERLTLGYPDDPPLSAVLLERDPTGAWAPHALEQRRRSQTVPQDALALTSFGLNPPHPAISRMAAALKNIEVHVPFEVTPGWVSRAHGRPSIPRGSSLIQSASSVERLGLNLANAWHALRSDVGEEHWRETMDYVRLGLGDRVESVNTRADPAGGSIALWVKLRGRDEQVPAAALSEGTLAYLAFVAMFRLPSKRSLLVFDEPEVHLHPRLLARVVGFFQRISERSPVLLATHSRRLLDELRDPATSAVLCELDEDGATRLRYPDRAALDDWLKDYDGLGRILDAGYEAEVMTRTEA